MSRRNGSARPLNQQAERARGNQSQTRRRFPLQLLVQHEAAKRHGHQNAQLVNGHNDARGALLQGPVIAEPGKPRRQSGQSDEQPAAPVDALDFMLLVLPEHNEPRHHKHNNRPDGGAEVGVHVLDSNLPQNGGQACQKRGQHGVKQPQVSPGCFRLLFLRLDHQIGADANQSHRASLEERHAFPQEYHGQQHGQHRAGLIHGGNLVHIPDLQRAEIAQPGAARCKAGEDKKNQAFCADGPKGRRRPRHKNHQPRKGGHNNRPQRGCKIGVDILNAQLRQDGHDSGKQRRGQCV